MSNQIVSMNKLKQFLKLSLKGHSYRQISEMTGTSRNTINKYKKVLDKYPLSYKELVHISDKELYSIVYPPSEDKPTHDELYGLFPQMDIQISRIGVTKFILWEEYKQSYPDGLQYSQFCEHLINEKIVIRNHDLAKEPICDRMCNSQFGATLPSHPNSFGFFTKSICN